MPDSLEAFEAPRLILCHKQTVSARLRFLHLPQGWLAFAPLPEHAVVTALSSPTPVSYHPGAWARLAAARLGIPSDALVIDPEFHAEARVGADAIPLLLGWFASIDPPFALAEQHHGAFATLADIRGASFTELSALRLAYEHLIG